MEPVKAQTLKTSEGKAMLEGQTMQINLEPCFSQIVSFPHTTESLSVYSLQNASSTPPAIPQRKHVPQK